MKRNDDALTEEELPFVKALVWPSRYGIKCNIFALSSCATLRRFIHVRRSFSQQLRHEEHAPYVSRHISSSPNFLCSANTSDMLDDGNYSFISGASFASLLLRRGDSRIWRNRLEDAVREAAISVAGWRSTAFIRQ
jgi:hypothetical protein